MGSRKKKTSKVNHIKEAYKQLDVLDRIALKSWLYWYGRQRKNLNDIFRTQCLSANFAALYVRNCVEDGHALNVGIYQRM